MFRAAVVSALCTVAAAAAPAKSFCAQSGWKQTWSDEFSGAALNTTAWSIDLHGGDSKVRDSQGTADNVYLEDGALVLRSQRKKAGKYNFTSGAVHSISGNWWKHAGGVRACVRAKLPGGETSGGRKSEGAGIWPAHWLMPQHGACWPSNGEIDIMEMINGDGQTHATYHWREREIGGCGDKCANGSSAPSCHHPSIGSQHADRKDVEEWHEYAVEYSKDHIHFALDGVVFQKLDTKSLDAKLNEKAEVMLVLLLVPLLVLLVVLLFRDARAAATARANAPLSVLRRAVLHDPQHRGGGPVAGGADRQDRVPDLPQN